MENILIVPIDGSATSLSALDFAIETSKKDNGNLILLNVQRQYDNLQSDNSLSGEQVYQMQKEKGLRVMEQAIKIATDKNVSFECKVRIGVETIEITNEAKEQKAKMIVLGSKGDGPVVSTVLGSVTYGVLHLATCPVTVVPDN